MFPHNTTAQKTASAYMCFIIIVYSLIIVGGIFFFSFQ